MLKTVCDNSSREPLSRSGSFCAILSKFSLLGVSVRTCSGFVSLRWTYYGLVWPFSTSVFPLVKREKSCSRNHRLGIEIRADNGRFFTFSGFPDDTLAARGG